MVSPHLLRRSFLSLDLAGGRGLGREPAPNFCCLAEL